MYTRVVKKVLSLTQEKSETQLVFWRQPSYSYLAESLLISKISFEILHSKLFFLIGA